MTKDRQGNIIPESKKMSKYLNFLYRNKNGRRFLKLLTNPKLSAMIGKFMDSPLSIPLIEPFIEKNHIDLSPCVKTKFRSFNDFFTRKLKPTARPISQNKEYLISPCDSRLTVCEITENSLFKIKGSRYSVADLVNNSFIANRYRDGLCLIFRLCVDDYHRYCYFDNGTKDENTFIPGELHTVNPIALEHYNIYKRNCREYTVLHTENFGDAVQIEVGAMLVGKIFNRHGKHRFKKGEEKGMFLFGGSTIVLLLESGKAAIDDDILRNSAKGIETVVHFGETIGRRCSEPLRDG